MLPVIYIPGHCGELHLDDASLPADAVGLEAVAGAAGDSLQLEGAGWVGCHGMPWGYHEDMMGISWGYGFWMDFAEDYGAFQQFPSGTWCARSDVLLQPTWDKPLWGEQTRITNQLLIRLSGMILQVAQTFKGLKDVETMGLKPPLGPVHVVRCSWAIPVDKPSTTPRLGISWKNIVPSNN